MITGASAAAFIAAGLLSVVIFPATGLAMLRRDAGAAAPASGKPSTPTPVLSAEDRVLCRASG